MKTPAKFMYCPVCTSEKTSDGSVVNSDGGSFAFKPKGLKWWKFLVTDTVTTKDTFRACKSCGHVWSQLDPLKLTKLLDS
jgi:uncharacterized Zn finger protein